MKRAIGILDIALVLGLVTGICAEEPTPWHHPLYIGGDGYWQARIRIEVTNDTDRDIMGVPISVPIGTGRRQLDLVGEEAKSVRVCDAAGNEFLFDIIDSTGAPVRDGLIQSGNSLVLPAECQAGSARPYYVYFRNPSAWSVPDFFEASVGIRNGGVEHGDTQPSGWQFDAMDDQHRVLWVTDDPHSGMRCLKTEVAEGAEPTWIAARQGDIYISGGSRYVLRGWVKAQDVEGTAGWYIHIGNESDSMIMNQVINDGDGTYDWRQTTFEFTAPEEANIASLGTVLRGTGTAWYDDVTLETIDTGVARRALTVRVGPKEEMKLATEPDADKWFQGDDRDWTRRVPARVLNFGDRPIEEKLTHARPGARLRGQAKEGRMVVVDAAGEVRPHIRSGDSLMFFGGAPARSISRYHVYFSDDERAATDGYPRRDSPRTRGSAKAQKLTYETLMAHNANLVRNPDFEDGDELPEAWQTGSEDRVRRDSPGLFGGHCARLDAAPDDPLRWMGWRQDIPARPNSTYFYGCYVKTENITGGQVRLHAHFHDKDGELSRMSGFFATSSSLQGTSDWTLLSGLMRTPADAASVELHLTMNARGTVWHDGVMLCEVTQATLGQMEYKMAKEITDYVVWQVNPLVKVFREDTPTGVASSNLRPIEIYMARNEREPVQLALRSAFPLKDVLVTVQSPANSRGEKLESVTVERVGYVPIDHPSSYYQTDLPPWRRAFPTSPGRTEGWSGWWPDPLLPMEKFDLPAHTTQPVWITVNVPKNARSGKYTGSITMEHGKASFLHPNIRISLQVNVWDFTLPDEPQLKVIYDLRNGRGWNFLNHENRRAWYKLMAEHRISPGLLPPPAIRYEDSRVIMDTEKFDEAASYCLDELNMNVFYTPRQFYCFGWGHPPRKFLGFEPFTPEYEAAYSACLRAFMDHLRENGWDSKVALYISDEPHYRIEGIVEQMQKLCDMIHAAEPDIKIYSSTWRHVPEWNGYLDIWGVGAYGVFPVDEMEARLRDGDELWFTTDGQMATDTPYCAIERLYPYYCWKYGVSGYEFWGVSWWTYDPFKFGWHSYGRQSPEPGRFVSVRYPNGDGFLTYPGWLRPSSGSEATRRDQTKRAVSSVRLEQVREGIEDYEYLHLLKQSIGTAKEMGLDTTRAEQAMAAAEELVTIPNAGGLRSTEILPDPDAVIKVRQRLGEEIVKLADALLLH